MLTYEDFIDEKEAGYPHLSVCDMIKGADGSIIVPWVCDNVGFGELLFYWDENGKPVLDTEYLDEDLVEAIVIEAVRRIRRTRWEDCKFTEVSSD